MSSSLRLSCILSYVCWIGRACSSVSVSTCCLALCFCFGLGCSLIIAEREDVFADHEFSLSILFTVKLRALATIPFVSPDNSKNTCFGLYYTASALDYHVPLLHPRRSFLSLEFLRPFPLEL